MANITLVNKTSKKVDEKLIVEAVEKVFIENNADDNTEAAVSVVDHKEVVRLAVLYMKETVEEALDHPVLSFLNSELEEEFVFPPDGKNHLGEIIVSYEMSSLRDKAPEELIDKSVDERLAYWASHGALHLMGIHHD